MPWISLTDAKKYLRVDFDDDDDLIGLLIEAAQSHVEAYTSTSFETRTATLSFANWRDVARLGVGPVQSIDSVEYLDPSGVEQTLAPDQYLVRGVGLSVAIRQPAGVAWPNVLNTGDAITVTATVGYGDGQLPGAVRQAALLILGDLYTFREDTMAERSVTPISLPNGVDALLANFRAY